MSDRIDILVLEDDPEWFDFVKDRVGDEYDLVHAESLEDAQEWIKVKNFRLAIVDLNLKDEIDESDRSGFMLIEELRAQEILRDMSILVFSRFDDSEELRTAFKSFKVFDFISKREFLNMPFKEIVDQAIAASYDGVDPRDW
jgi:DNA-binding response OmpR family regulator